MQPSQNINNLVWHQHAIVNKIQTLILLGVMAGFMALLGWMIWGKMGLYILSISGLLILIFNPQISPMFIMRLYRATPLDVSDAPQLYRILGELSRRAELPQTPRLYYVPSGMINAFTVGKPDDAVIGVTDGLLQTLNLREATAVLAHEISHIRNNDLRVMSMADMFSRLTASMSLFGQLLLFINLPLILFSQVSINWFAILLLVFAPTLSTLAQLGLSRTREFDADLNAARLTGDPEALASALLKIDRIQGNWMQRIFFPGRGIPEPSMLRTHPPTEERVKRLRELKIAITPQYEPFDFDDLTQRLHELPHAGIQRPPRWRISGLWH